jgi:D-beta-D-heptose 7-phosphate kinase/D-beta-D-heptose 1-phosphate adenosyltransferase
MSVSLTTTRVQQLLSAAARTRILVLGDVMLDQFIWGSVSRISPEAPVPVLDFSHESYMPGGAANVARNLSALKGLVSVDSRATTIKTRIVAHQQQVVRVDRESKQELGATDTQTILRSLKRKMPAADAVIVGDYGKGVVTQPLLEGVKTLCREHGVWLSVDPKPVHHLNLAALSLITPNRKEAFELANVIDGSRQANPLEDKSLMLVANRLLNELRPAVLLITLGDQGMLLCQRGQEPFHIPTVAQEVFDVSGAGDTVIASFTLAIAAGASPIEAAIVSNHAAGVVVGKVGTATVTPEELLNSFNGRK